MASSSTTVSHISTRARCEHGSSAGPANIAVLAHHLAWPSCAAQVVEDFAADNCVYLELRTTPKVPAVRAAVAGAQRACRATGRLPLPKPGPGSASCCVSVSRLATARPQCACPDTDFTRLHFTVTKEVCKCTDHAFRFTYHSFQARPEYGMTKQSYLEAVLAGVQQFYEAAQGSAGSAGPRAASGGSVVFSLGGLSLPVAATSRALGGLLQSCAPSRQAP